MSDCLVSQDNKSTILFVKNGGSSSAWRTQYTINKRYFFAKDRFQSKRISLNQCPPREMSTDYF